MQLTKNFSVTELTYSVTASANNIDNRPSVDVVENLRLLCEKVLQPLRDKLGCPVLVTSGYRCRLLNEKIGGAKNSQHLYGQAADIVVPQRNLKDVFCFIKNNLIFDQLLYEKSHKNCWIHVSYRKDGKNRRQAIDNYNG